MNPEVMTMYHCSLLKSFDICWLTAAVFTLPHHVIFTPLMTKHGNEYHSDEQRRKKGSQPSAILVAKRLPHSSPHANVAMHT
jgi:hypothetical protein